jgi:hypothetical protein
MELLIGGSPACGLLLRAYGDWFNAAREIAIRQPATIFFPSILTLNEGMQFSTFPAQLGHTVFQCQP